MKCYGPECSTSSMHGSTQTNSGCRCECGLSPLSSSAGNGCNCTVCTGQNPLEFTEMLWHKVAIEAMIEVKKEKIKARIEQSFGPAIDKGADAVVSAIQKKMQATMQNAQGEQELKNKLASIMSEALGNK